MQDAKPAPIALSVREVATTLGLGIETARRMTRAGTIPAVRLGGRVVVLRRDLDRMLEQHRIAAPVGG